MSPARTAPLRLHGKTGTLRERQFVVTVTSGPDAGRSVTLDGTVLVGSHPDNTLCLADPSVSRYHLELHVVSEGVVIRDLESTNGTFLAGGRVDSVTIESEATLTVGHSTLRVALVERDLGPAESARTSFGKAIGQCLPMRRLFGLLERVAQTDATVLLIGETGTGKEVLAEGLHLESARKDKPFVVLDCGAIAPNLIESQLFGHARGAFTDAHAERTGAFLDANGGTLFIDEIGELPIDLQPKLLRALEAGVVKRLGEDTARKFDVRVVAATHRNLVEEVEAGRFRRDLYFRLAVIVTSVPPLRERVEDLPLLVKHFVQQLGRGDFDLPPALYERLKAHAWPGNIRELRNVVQRALVGADIDPFPAPAARASSAAAPVAGAEMADLQFKEAKDRLVDAFAKDYLSALLERCSGNLSAVARSAGLNRNYVRQLVTRYGLKASD